MVYLLPRAYSAVWYLFRKVTLYSLWASEQLGFLGAMAILILIVLLLLRTMNAARKSCDDLGTYMCFGFFAMIAFQSVINLGHVFEPSPCYGRNIAVFQCRGLFRCLFVFGFWSCTKCIYA